MPQWDPDRYLAHADERGRPYVELLARIEAEDPALVVDLGCGPGGLTALLLQRWPGAAVLGVDSSTEMITRARADHAELVRSGSLTFAVADLREGGAGGAGEPVDVLISNATLQWVPGHLQLLPELVSRVRPGGWFGFGVPANFDQPSHTLRRELAAEPPFRDHTEDLAEPASHDAAVYRDALVDLGCRVDAWETTYLHELSGPDPVLSWISGTSARPVLQALPTELRDAFVAELGSRLRAAYPAERDGVVVMPFRRVFVVAQAPGGAPGVPAA